MKLFIDIETFYDRTVSYDLRKLSIVEYCRDTRFKLFGLAYAMADMPVEWISGKDVEGWFKSFRTSDLDVVAFNCKFDLFALTNLFPWLEFSSYIDPLAMSRACLGKTVKSHSLGSLAQHFGLAEKGQMHTEGKRELTRIEESELSEYSKHDVDLCRQIFNRLVLNFPTNQYPAMTQTVKMFTHPKLQLNVPLLEKAATEEALRRENIFKEIGIDKKEFASNVKFPLLLGHRGFTVPTKPSPRKMDSSGNPIQIPALALGDTEFLEMLEGENEELKALCEARVAAKSTLLETRSNKLAKIGRTGYWPFDVEFSGADQTHRFSGGSGAGGNPQNFTRGSALREAVEAPEGCELVVGDAANIELRMVAWLAKDPGLVDAISTGKDLYCDFASAFYGRTVTKVDKEARKFGKTAILGLQYGCGWKKFIRVVRVQTGQTIDEEASRKAVDLYRTRYAQIPALWQMLDNAIGTMKSNGLTHHWHIPVEIGYECLILPSGLKIRFPNLRQEEGERGNIEWVYDVWVKGHLEKRKLYGAKLLENVSQALTGEFIKNVSIQMGDCVSGQIHDEIICVARKGFAPIIAAKLKRLMGTPPEWLPQIKLDSEIKIGENWLACK